MASFPSSQILWIIKLLSGVLNTITIVLEEPSSAIDFQRVRETKLGFVLSRCQVKGMS